LHLAEVVTDRPSETRSGPRFYLTSANHWSYIGLGWTLGVESVVESVEQMLTVSEAAGVRFAIEFDARSYEKLAECYPAVLRRLRDAVNEGKFEIVGGSYSQPLASLISGESAIRQLVIGREIVRRLLGVEVETFLHEEEFAHPQVPQLLLKAGYRFASMAQVDTCGRQGTPLVEHNAFWWEGIDGSAILTAPKNALVIAEYQVDFDEVVSSPEFAELSRHSPPLLTLWEELGWDFIGSPMSLANIPIGADRLIDRYQGLSASYAVEYTTIGNYLRAYDADLAPQVRLREDDWKRVLPWGIGGDQIRRLYRRTEGLLLSVEALDAVVAASDNQSVPVPDLAQHWRDVLTPQSHDVALLEYTVINGAPPPLDRRESVWNRSWGQIGFDHVLASERATQTEAARLLARADEDGPEGSDTRMLLVFNPTARPRSEVVDVEGVVARVGATGAVVVDGDRRTPAQLVSTDTNEQGQFVTGSILFVATDVPAFGFKRFELSTGEGPPADTVISVSPDGLHFSNGILTVELSSDDGTIKSLRRVDDPFDPFEGGNGLFFEGDHNPRYPLSGLFYQLQEPGRTVAGDFHYDSRLHSCSIDVLESGPVRVRVRVRHEWPLLMVEFVLALVAGSDELEVFTRLATHVPPSNGFLTVDRATDFTSAVMAEFKEPMPIRGGYWLRWHLGFEPERIVRDLPFAADEPEATEFTAWSFVDARRSDGAGLLVVHTATQYFTRDGALVSNVLVREWESFWGNNYGWPVLAEYEHRLVPHSWEPSLAEMAARAQRVARPLLARAGGGTTPAPPPSVLVTVEAGTCEVSSLRRTDVSTVECRLVETAGRGGTVELAVGVGALVLDDVDFEGRSAGPRIERARASVPFHLELSPWEVKTLRFSLGSNGAP
jgi:hypothetical protein